MKIIVAIVFIASSSTTFADFVYPNADFVNGYFQLKAQQSDHCYQAVNFGTTFDFRGLDLTLHNNPAEKIKTRYEYWNVTTNVAPHETDGTIFSTTYSSSRTSITQTAEMIRTRNGSTVVSQEITTLVFSGQGRHASIQTQLQARLISDTKWSVLSRLRCDYVRGEIPTPGQD